MPTIRKRVIRSTSLREELEDKTSDLKVKKRRCETLRFTLIEQWATATKVNMPQQRLFNKSKSFFEDMLER